MNDSRIHPRYIKQNEIYWTDVLGEWMRIQIKSQPICKDGVWIFWGILLEIKMMKDFRWDGHSYDGISCDPLPRIYRKRIK